MGLFDKYREWKYDREVDKARQSTESIAIGFWELYHLAITCHGRYQLASVINSANDNEIEMDPQVLSLYQFVMLTAPYQAYATIN